jgi:hypothetical protein
MKIGSYRLPWRLLILSHLALGVIVAAGVAFSYALDAYFDASLLPDAVIDVARFFTAYWWVLLMVGYAVLQLLSTAFILLNSEQAWWGRMSWALLGLFFPFGGVVYWVDCIERSSLSLRQRATRIAGGLIGVYLLIFGVASILWPEGRLPFAAEVAMGVASIALSLWLLSQALGWGGFRRHHQPPTADA